MVHSHMAIVLDVNEYMNKKTFMNLTYFDTAKALIEKFLRWKCRNYVNMHVFVTLKNKEFSAMLLNAPNDDLQAIINKVKNFSCFSKNITSSSSSCNKFEQASLTESINFVRSFVNAFRYTSGIDTIGVGRQPMFVEPTTIQIYTSTKFVEGGDFLNFVNAEKNDYFFEQMRRYEYFPFSNESFYEASNRWDQKVSVVDICMPESGGELPQHVPHYELTIKDLYSNSPKLMELVFDSNGIWVSCYNEASLQTYSKSISYANFFGPAGNKTEENLLPIDFCFGEDVCRVYLQLKEISTSGNCFFPIPDDVNFSMEDSGLVTVGHRMPIPRIYFDKTGSKTPQHLPCDSFKIEFATALKTTSTTKNIEKKTAEQILFSKFADKNKEVFFMGRCNTSAKDLYFCTVKKDETVGGGFCLNVYPYGFDVLYSFFEEVLQASVNPVTKKVVMQNKNFRPAQKWVQSFEQYLNSVPLYCVQYIRSAIKKMGFGQAANMLIPENSDTKKLAPLTNAIKKLKLISKNVYDGAFGFMLNSFNYFSDELTLLDSEDDFVIPVKEYYFFSDNEIDYRNILSNKEKIKEFKVKIENYENFLHPFVQLKKLPFDGESNCVKNNNSFEDNLKSLLLAKDKAEKLINSRKVTDFNNNTVPITVMSDFKSVEEKRLRIVDVIGTQVHSMGNPFKAPPLSKTTESDAFDQNIEFVVEENNVEIANDSFISDRSSLKIRKKWQRKLARYLSMIDIKSILIEDDDEKGCDAVDDFVNDQEINEMYRQVLMFARNGSVTKSRLEQIKKLVNSLQTKLYCVYKNRPNKVVQNLISYLKAFNIHI